MSYSEVNQNRESLYNKYRYSNPELANAYRGQIPSYSPIGVCFLISAIAVTIFLLVLMRDDLSRGASTFAIPGSCAAIGIIILAIDHYKTRNMLNEQLSESQIQEILQQHGTELNDLGDSSNNT